MQLKINRRKKPVPYFANLSINRGFFCPTSNILICWSTENAGLNQANMDREHESGKNAEDLQMMGHVAKRHGRG